MKKISLLLNSIILTGCISAQSPTWNANVAPIIFNNCSSCHHEGAIAPFPLMSYNDVVDNAYGLESSIVSGIMPPWNADTTYMHYTNERVLTADEINTIVNWISGGFEEGTGTAPEPPVFPVGSQMPVIDMSLTLPTYTVTKDLDEFRKFVIHSGFTETTFLEAFEFLPDNGSIIHHMKIFADTSDISWLADEADTAVGYNGDGDMDATTKMIGGWVPGGYIGNLPSGMAMAIDSGTDFVVELHYAPGSLGQSATPVINFKWSDDPSPRLVNISPMLKYTPPCLQEPELYIPANTIDTFHEISDGSYASDISLIAVAPHMHYLGKTFWVYGKKTGEDTIPLIKINNWDFHWQGEYTFQKLIHIKDGTPLYGIASFDNTTDNPDNPTNPPVDVYSGGRTTDEMMTVYITYVNYLPGDEDVILDSTLLFSDSPIIPALHFNIFPNPTADIIYIQDQNAFQQLYQITISDMAGNIIRSDEMQYPITTKSLDVKSLPEGIYLLHIFSDQNVYHSTFVKVSK